jgi:gliding motility-associated-like protein
MTVRSFPLRALALALLWPLAAAAGTGPSAEGPPAPRQGAPGPRFVANLGQWAGREAPRADYAFAAELPHGALFVEDGRLTWRFHHPDDLDAVEEAKQNGTPAPPGGFLVRGHAFRTVFPGAGRPRAEALVPAEAHVRNYFLGADPARWRGRVPEYAAVGLPGLWPGVDLRLYAADGTLKYDFVVAPGAPAERVLLAWEGVDPPRVSPDRLVLRHAAGTLVEARPYAYQVIRGDVREVPCAFADRGGGRVGFELGRYDTRHPLVIDPVLVFATFSGSTSDNWGYTATYDEAGHAYGGGIVFGAGYPATTGAFQVTFGGGAAPLPCDVALTKYTPDGSAQVWSSYLGGSGNEFPQSMIVAPSGECYVYGSTGSADFPVTPGCWDAGFGGGTPVTVTSIDFTAGSDIYVARISADGGTLLGATYVGGTANDGLNIDADLEYNYGDHARGEIILAPDGGPIVASSSYSSNFPTGGGSADPTFNGAQDGVLFHLDTGLGNLLWSTFLGGSQADGAYSVKIHDASGDLLVCGGTRSANFPVTPGALTPTAPGGPADGWVARLTGGATAITAATYLGTPAYDQAYFVERDDDGEVYVTGQTRGTWPIAGTTYADPGSSQFIHKLDADLGGTVYSTVFGTGSSAVNVSPTAFLVDVCENVYVSGWGGVVNNGFNPSTGSMSGMPLTADAFQSTTDGSDFYFFVLAKNAVSLLYASYFGGGLVGATVSREHVDGGTSRFDERGVIYQAVCAGCGGLDAFPVTPGAWSETNGAANCNLGTLKFAFDLSGVEAVSDAFPAITGCAPFTVDFENASTGASDYVWDFGDGSPTSTDFEPAHTYTLPGTFTVQLVAIDSNSCNIADTSFLTIIAGIDSIAAVATLDETVFCDTLWATFTDFSATLGPSTQYAWDLGDGTVRDDTTGFTHVYTSPGSYTVTLVLTDSLSCNLADTISWVIDYASAFESGFDVSFEGCAPVTARFTNDFADGDAYAWDFGDGGTGSGLDPTHVYAAPGTYPVTLETTYCGVTQAFTANVEVPLDPVAFFDNEPYATILGSPVTFTNLSQFANAYTWAFGDGSVSAAVNPTHTYAGQGTFTVCLTARNDAGCEDTYCREIDVEFDGFIDVPNAFTPNGDGSNDRFRVRGFGVEAFRLRIVNRWGEVVYEGTDMAEGWDGTFRGKPQEMDAYAWTLDVRFSNGRSETRQGNVTLLR